ncbi:MAG TPA: FG-GAP-like repeat-containing protein [Terriglobales bacterium]|nr:FG-GAP-like repeat-containing protein [Terriglobales bacterium]
MRTWIAGCMVAAGLHGAGLALLRQDLQLTQALAVGGSIAVGDFNGDGRPDLVVGMAGGLAVMLNLGHGTFGPAISTGILQPAPAAIADFNHDGKLDLAAAGQIALGRGDGTFEPPRPMSPTWFVAEAADFNGDGLPDLAVVQTGACGNGGPACSLLLIVLGNGDGTFRPADRAQILGGYKPLAADFNHDGKPDLAVSFGNAIAVFLGDGAGSFRALAAITLPEGIFTGTPLAADLNGDGILDLVSRSHVLFGLGDGTFQPPIPYAPVAGASTPVAETAFALTDLDGDGRIDLATVENAPDQPVTNRLRIFLGRGDGIFSAPVELAVGWGPGAGIAADFEGDGRVDLLVSNWRSNSLSLLLAKAGTQGALRAVSAGDGTAVVAPGSLATLYLPLGVPAQSATSPWPSALSGVTVQIDDGQSKGLANLLYVSEGQINFQVPPETRPSNLTDALIVVTRDGAVVQTGSMHVASVAPTLFMADPSWAMPAAINTIIDQQGRQSSLPVFDCTAAGACNFHAVSPSTQASYVSFYGTGFQGATTANVQCWISGKAIKVEYAGPQGTPGLDQINILLPGPDDDFWEPPYVEAHISINGTLANTAVLTLARYF